MEKVKLENICVFIRNGANIKNDRLRRGIPITRIETIANGIIDEKSVGYADIFDEKYKDYYLKQGDILMSHINSMKHLGKVAICKEDRKIIHGMNLLNIRIQDTVYPQYVYYYFKTDNFKQQLNKMSKQSINQSSFTVNDLRKILICLPQLQEQRKIANRLDKLQDIIDIRKRQLEDLENLIKSLFIDMFGELDNHNWKNDSLENLTLKITDGKHGGCQKQENSGYYFIGATEIYNNRINYETANQIAKKDFEKDYARCNLKINDFVIVNTGATIGKSAIVDNIICEKTLLQKSVALIRVKHESILPIYLKYCYECNPSLYSKGQGCARVNLLLSQIKNTIIPVPPIELQNKFAELVKQINTQKNELQKNLKEMQVLQESLMSKYFY